jgi:Erv1 / Alr family
MWPFVNWFERSLVGDPGSDEATFIFSPGSNASSRLKDATRKGLAGAQPVLGLVSESLSRSQPDRLSNKAVTKEVLGRSTWTLLHTLAAQYPINPTRSQERDVRTLVLPLHLLSQKCDSVVIRIIHGLLTQFNTLVQIDVLTRIYPCNECAGHFKKVVR